MSSLRDDHCYQQWYIALDFFWHFKTCYHQLVLGGHKLYYPYSI